MDLRNLPKRHLISEKIAKNPIVHNLSKMALKEIPNLYNKGASKIKNKNLRALANSNLANMLVDSGAPFVHDKL